MAVECTCLTNSNNPGLEHMDHCAMSKYVPDNVLVFRNEVSQPVSIPQATVLENDRTYRSYQKHEQGHSWAQIAAMEDYDNARQVMYEVQRWLDEGRALISDRTRRDMLQMEVARMDALQAAVWPDAMKGKIPAAQFALQCIAARIKTLHLDEMQDGEEELAGPRTVIVPNDEGGFLEVLERVANEGST